MLGSLLIFQVEKVRKLVLYIHAFWPPRHFPPSRRQPATISCSCNQFDVSPYKSHRVMQYNTWKRVSPSNPVSSHPARSSLFLSPLLYISETATPLRSLRFVLKHPKSCARRDRTSAHRKVSLCRVVAGAYLSTIRFHQTFAVSELTHRKVSRWQREGWYCYKNRLFSTFPTVCHCLSYRNLDYRDIL